MSHKPRLFSYTIPFDDGAAPNPFRGMCTLAICKPAIRRVAQIGDWIVGLGSVAAPSGDLRGRLVYAMHVEEVISVREYDLRAQYEWQHRIPDVASLDLSERLGDCIYDFCDSTEPRQRASVHGPENEERDLSGRNVLISRDFYYFGSRAIQLPRPLLGLCQQTQGHRSTANDALFEPFVTWIRGLGLAPGQLYGWPDQILDWSNMVAGRGCSARASERDEPIC